MSERAMMLILAEAALLAAAVAWIVWVHARFAGERAARVDAERELERKAELARSILDTAGAAFVACDGEGRVVSWNPQAEEIFGWRREAVLGQPIAETLVPPRDRATFASAFARYLRLDGIAARRLEVRAVRLDQSEVPVEVTLSTLRSPAGAVVNAFIQDITVRKQAEERLETLHHELELAHERLEARVEERTEALVRANRDLETLLNVISHDLKEPLRAIENFSRLLSERYADRLDETGRDFVDRVVRGSGRMRQLLADIHLLSRVRRMGTATVQEVASEAVIAEAIARLEARIKQCGAEIRVGSDLPRIRSARVFAVEAVYNLIANALKFTSPGEPPVIEIDRYVAEAGELEGVGLVVRDRGPGVAPEQARRIFELFQRGVGRDVEGTGAGLAIVREVAERHGGGAWVRPRKGGGSEFVITFSGTELELAASAGVRGHSPGPEGRPAA